MDAIQSVGQHSMLRQIHQQFTRRVVDLAAGDVAVAARVLRLPPDSLAKELRQVEGGRLDRTA